MCWHERTERKWNSAQVSITHGPLKSKQLTLFSNLTSAAPLQQQQRRWRGQQAKSISHLYVDMFTARLWLLKYVRQCAVAIMYVRLILTVNIHTKTLRQGHGRDHNSVNSRVEHCDDSCCFRGTFFVLCRISSTWVSEWASRMYVCLTQHNKTHNVVFCYDVTVKYCCYYWAFVCACVRVCVCVVGMCATVEYCGWVSTADSLYTITATSITRYWLIHAISALWYALGVA